MLKEEKGITAGTAVLIIAVVAAAIGGGLYQVTQLQSSAPEKFSLTVSKEGAGHVALELEGGVYENGEEVTVRALPPPEGVFEGWTGDVSKDSSTITVVMDSDKHLVANFSAEGNQPPVAVIDGAVLGFMRTVRLQLTAENSYDPDGRIVSYKWELSTGHVFQGMKIGKNIEPPNESEAPLRVTLTVEDEDGAKSVAVHTGVGIIKHGENEDTENNRKEGEDNLYPKVKYPSLAELPEDRMTWNSSIVRIKENRIEMTWSLHENTSCISPNKDIGDLVTWEENGSLKFRKVFTGYTFADDGWFRIAPMIQKDNTLMIRQVFDADAVTACVSKFWLTGTVNRFRGSENVPSELEDIRFQFINKYAQDEED